MRFSTIQVLAVIALCTVAAGAQPLKVTASTDRTSLALNQRLTLTIELSGPAANEVGTPQPPETGGFLEFIGSGGTSQNIQFINGRMSVSRSFSYFYMAVKPGTFNLPAVSVVHEGETYRSDPIEITVSKTAAPPSSRSPAARETDQGGGDDLFVRALVDRKRVYQNQPVIVTFRIYTRVSVSNYAISRLPETSGFWTEELEIPGGPKTRDEVINGIRYTVADIKKQALFPTSPGTVTVGPMALDCEVRVARRRSRDIFDSFFDDPFFGRTVRKSILSQPVEIRVDPLPPPPEDLAFTGAVGRYDLSASVDKNDVKTDEAVTLKVELSGRGNIKIAPAPEVTIPADFEQYDPKVTQNINRSGAAISGRKTYEYVLVPRFPGELTIRPIRYSYFDPDARRYRTLSTPEMTIRVSKGTSEFLAAGSGLSKEEVRLIGQDIRFIKLSSPALRPRNARVYHSVLYPLFSVLPLLLVLGAYLYRNHAEKLSENEAYARSRHAKRSAHKALSRAKAHLDEDRGGEFYSQISRALVGFLADKLDLPEAGLVSDEMTARLRGRGVDAGQIDEVMDLLQTCDYLRFAPSRATRDDNVRFHQRARETILKLEKIL